MSGQGFDRPLRAVPYWPCTVKIFVRYKTRDPKEHFLKVWAESIQRLQRNGTNKIDNETKTNRRMDGRTDEQKLEDF